VAGLLEVRDYILRQVDAEREHVVVAVTSGSASSFDDYSNLIGRIRGLDRARELIVEGFRNYDSEDEDDGVGI
jgi:hypothetical protein